MKIQEVATSSKTAKMQAKKQSKLITDRLSAEVLNNYLTGGVNQKPSKQSDIKRLMLEVQTLKSEQKYLIEKITEERLDMDQIDKQRTS